MSTCLPAQHRLGPVRPGGEPGTGAGARIPPDLHGSGPGGARQEGNHGSNPVRSLADVAELPPLSGVQRGSNPTDGRLGGASPKLPAVADNRTEQVLPHRTAADITQVHK